MPFSQYRMLFVVGIGVFIFLSGLFFDIWPKVMKFCQIHYDVKNIQEKYHSEMNFIKNEANIHKQVRELKPKLANYLRINNRSSVEAECLTAILKAGEVNGFLIQSMQPEKWSSHSGVEEISIRLVGLGKLIQIAEFLAMLSSYSLPVLLSDFECRMDKNGLIKTTLHLKGYFLPTAQQDHPVKLWLPIKKMNFNHAARDPFLPQLKNSVELVDFPIEMDVLLQSVSLNQIKLVGYMRYKDRFWTLAMLPNGQTFEIFVGKMLGSEKGRVVRVSEDQVVVDVSGRLIRIA